MRKKYPSIVRVLVALAMVVSLVGIAVAPVGAQPPQVNEVTASPYTAGSAATYTINFDTLLPVVGGTLTIGFPDEVTLPAQIDKSLISLQDGEIGGWVYFDEDSDPDPTVSGQDVIITIPAGDTMDAGTCILTISQGAGIVNPAIAKTPAAGNYEVDVETSEEVVGTGFLGIIPSYKLSVSHEKRFGEVTVTGKGWAAERSVSIGGALDGSGVTDEDGTFSIVCAPVTNGDVTVQDGAGQSADDAEWDFDGVGGSDVSIKQFDLDPRIEIDPVSGRMGTTVTIDGYDFTENGAIVEVTVAGEDATWTGGGFEQIDSFDPPGDGNDDFTLEIDIPDDVGSGAKTIQVKDNGVPVKSAKATFTIAKPTLTMTPSSGSVGDNLTVVGSNFPADVKDGQVDFGDGLLVEDVPATDAAGGFTVSFDVPDDAASGYNDVVATFGNAEAKGKFLVAKRLLTIVPDHGPMGTRVTISGKDMTPDAFIVVGEVVIGDKGFEDFDENIEIDSRGDVPPTEMEVPCGLDYGANKVTAVDDDAAPKTAEGSFEVTQPTITVDPERGYMGDTITVTGKGWIPGGDELVTLEFNGKTMLTIEPDANGGFLARFKVPTDAKDTNEIGASDNYGKCENGNTAPTVFFFREKEELDVDPQEGPAGTEVTVTGIGFDPQFPLEELLIGGADVKPIPAPVTDKSGTFTATFIVPGLKEGSHSVKAKIHGDTKSSFFIIVAAEDTVADALESIMDVLVIVWGYDEEADEWLFFDPDDPASDLDTLEVGSGYWLKVDEATTLIYGGSSYSLAMGWKNIGWLGD